MKNLIFYCLMLMTLRAGSQTVQQSIDELLKAHARQNTFNGTVLVAQHGKLIMQKGYGFQDYKKNQKNDELTLFQVGSITKQFTATLILQLQEKKLLSIRDPLSRFIPDFPRGDSITIENLLNHTSGIYNYTNDDEFMMSQSSKPIAVLDLIARFKQQPLEFKPGSQYHYSNSGYVLLGYIIEKLSGKTWYQVIREQILTPLQLNHSGFDFKNLIDPHKATGYLKFTTKQQVPATIVDSSVSYAAGALYTTAGDLYRWNQALYNHTILSDSSLNSAFTPHLAKYGYGWVIDSSFGKKVEMHEGGIFGFAGFIARIPADSTCIILIDNTGSPNLARIAQDINALLNDQPYDFPKLHQEIELDTALLRQYTGEFLLGPGFSLTISMTDGNLFVKPTSQQPTQLFAESKDHFFMKMTNASIIFFRDLNGRINDLILYQDDRKFPGKRVR